MCDRISCGVGGAETSRGGPIFVGIIGARGGFRKGVAVEERSQIMKEVAGGVEEEGIMGRGTGGKIDVV